VLAKCRKLTPKWKWDRFFEEGKGGKQQSKGRRREKETQELERRRKQEGDHPVECRGDGSKRGGGKIFVTLFKTCEGTPQKIERKKMD